MKTKFTILISSITILVITISCVPNAEETCDTTGIGLISKETSQLLADNYKASILTSEFNKPDNPDSRSVWFSYDEIKRYLCVLESEYKKKHGDSTDLSKLGIRVYFGRYPKQGDLQKIDDLKDVFDKNVASNQNIPEWRPRIEYGEKHCLFFVPTYDDENNIHQDFMLDELVTDPKAPSGIMLINKNHGGLAPPESMDGATYLNE